MYRCEYRSRIEFEYKMMPFLFATRTVMIMTSELVAASDFLAFVSSWHNGNEI